MPKIYHYALHLKENIIVAQCNQQGSFLSFAFINNLPMHIQIRGFFILLLLLLTQCKTGNVNRLNEDFDRDKIEESKRMFSLASGNTNIPRDILIHTFDHSRVERDDFYRYTHWYEEKNNTQIFKLHPGDCNTRNERKYCRIEAHTDLKMKKGEKHEFTATYKIIKLEEIACIFQVFNSSVVHPQLYIKMMPNGDLRYQSRGNPPGLIAPDCIGKEFTLHIKDDGYKWQLYYNEQKISEGPHQEKGEDTVCEFRWGLYNNNIPSTEMKSIVHDVVIK